MFGNAWQVSVLEILRIVPNCQTLAGHPNSLNLLSKSSIEIFDHKNPGYRGAAFKCVPTSLLLAIIYCRFMWILSTCRLKSKRFAWRINFGTLSQNRPLFRVWTESVPAESVENFYSLNSCFYLFYHLPHNSDNDRHDKLSPQEFLKFLPTYFPLLSFSS